MAAWRDCSPIFAADSRLGPRAASNEPPAQDRQAVDGQTSEGDVAADKIFVSRSFGVHLEQVNPAHMKHLVPGRTCGDCTLCCIVPVIDMPEAQKLPSSVCRHCSLGCEIYDARPQVCRNYDCGWRQLDMFDADWRPDLSGVFIEFEMNIPPQFQIAFGLNLVLVGNPLKTIRQQRFLDFVSASITNNRPLFLGLKGPRGMQACKLPLNTGEIYEALRRGRSDLRLALEKTLKRLVDHTYAPHILRNAGNDMST